MASSSLILTVLLALTAPSTCPKTFPSHLILVPILLVRLLQQVFPFFGCSCSPSSLCLWHHLLNLYSHRVFPTATSEKQRLHALKTNFVADWPLRRAPRCLFTIGWYLTSTKFVSTALCSRSSASSFLAQSSLNVLLLELSSPPFCSISHSSASSFTSQLELLSRFLELLIFLISVKSSHSLHRVSSFLSMSSVNLTLHPPGFSFAQVQLISSSTLHPHDQPHCVLDQICWLFFPWYFTYLRLIFFRACRPSPHHTTTTLLCACFCQNV